MSCLPRTIFACVLFATSTIGCRTLPPDATDEPFLTVVSYNIRFDDIEANGRKSWESRRQAIISIVRRIDPDVIALQEVASARGQSIETSRQFAWLNQQLTGYFVAETQGPHGVPLPIPIFYRTARLTPIDQGVIALPPIRGDGEGVRRYVVWAEFADSMTGTSFRVSNTHLDRGLFSYRASASRMKSLLLLGELMESGDPGATLILAGDFNAERSVGEFNALTGRVDHVATDYLGGTYHGFAGFPWFVEIDHIFVSSDIDVVDAYTERRGAETRSGSDHFPVVATLRLPGYPSEQLDAGEASESGDPNEPGYPSDPSDPAARGESSDPRDPRDRLPRSGIPMPQERSPLRCQFPRRYDGPSEIK